MRFTRMISLAILYAIVLLGTLLLAACTDENSSLPAPVGADKGQNTFLFFFTDN